MTSVLALAARCARKAALYFAASGDSGVASGDIFGVDVPVPLGDDIQFGAFGDCRCLSGVLQPPVVALDDDLSS